MGAVCDMAQCKCCKGDFKHGGNGVVICDRCKGVGITRDEGDGGGIRPERKRRGPKADASVVTRVEAPRRVGASPPPGHPRPRQRTDTDMLWTISDKLSEMNSNCSGRLMQIQDNITAMKDSQEVISTQYDDLLEEVKGLRNGSTVLEDEVKGLQRSLAAIDVEIVDLTLRLNEMDDTHGVDTTLDRSTSEILKEIDREEGPANENLQFLRQHRGLVL